MDDSFRIFAKAWFLLAGEGMSVMGGYLGWIPGTFPKWKFSKCFQNFRYQFIRSIFRLRTFTRRASNLFLLRFRKYVELPPRCLVKVATIVLFTVYSLSSAFVSHYLRTTYDGIWFISSMSFSKVIGNCVRWELMDTESC